MHVRRAPHTAVGLLPHSCGLFRTPSTRTSSPSASPRWPTVVGCRGLEVVGDAGSLTLRCSATPIGCKHCHVWINSCVKSSVRTTTTTQPPQRDFFSCVAYPCKPLRVMSDVARTGAAKRRRERRLRSWLRHEPRLSCPQPFTTVVVGSKETTSAHGHRRRSSTTETGDTTSGDAAGQSGEGAA